MSVVRALAGVALILGLAAPFAAGPPTSPRPARAGISALELAAWIRDRKPVLRIIDARPAADFNAYQIPTAESAAQLDPATVGATDIVVVYTADGTPAATTVVRALKAGRILELDGGILAWMDEVMSPVRSTELTRYFGGIGRPAGAPPPAGAAPSTAERVKALKRRGC